LLLVAVWIAVALETTRASAEPPRTVLLLGDRRLAIESHRRNGAEVELSVSDSGAGIPSGNLESLFDTFFTTKPSGTGLGLSIARTIVESYKGRLWAENGASGGAVFRLTLPLVEMARA